MTMVMKKVTASEFKAKCLALMDEVAEKQTQILVTKRGKIVAKLVPADKPKPTKVVGSMKGTFEIVDPKDDLFSTGIEWEMDLPNIKKLGL